MGFWDTPNGTPIKVTSDKKPVKELNVETLIQKYTKEEVVLGRKNRFQKAVLKNIRNAVRKEIRDILRYRPKPKKPFKVYLSEFFAFGTSTLIIFFLLLLLSNVQAYMQVASYWWDSFTGEHAHVAANLEKLAKVDEKTKETVSVDPLKLSASTPKMDTSMIADTLKDISIPVYPPDNRIVIPKIGQNIPIQEVSSENLLKEQWQALEDDIQKALEKGVVHYPGTAVPGQIGNVFITGHSSYYVWSPGKYKDTFALLHNMSIGDSVIIYYNENKYTYMIEDIKVVSPDQIDVLKQTDDKRLTLMTCTPIGTALNRLIITAKQV